MVTCAYAKAIEHASDDTDSDPDAQQLAVPNEAFDVARPYLELSGEGLFGQLAQIMHVWKTEWATELRSSVAWASVRPRLTAIRKLIDEEYLLSAEFELSDLLVQGPRGYIVREE